MRVLMTPNPLNLSTGESGIHTLVRKYAEHLPKFDVEFVESDEFDVQAVHAGMTREFANSAPIVSHLHGLYWTADYPAYNWQHRANRDVTESIRRATITTVPSPWVAKTLQRDMHLNPIVIPHGIDAEEWIHNEKDEGYVLWNKNRDSDVCSPVPVRELARRFPDIKFVTTFYPRGEQVPDNVEVIGIQKHSDMKKIIQRCKLYLSTTKETFCIGALEAMASRKPILCFDEGNITELVSHGTNGYIASCFNYEDLSQGLSYCLNYSSILGDNGAEMVKKWTWENAAQQVVSAYEKAIELYSQPRDITVVIPCYNKERTLERAVNSALNQTRPAKQIIIVNNNSTDHSYSEALRLADAHKTVTVMNESKQGVAHARNSGIYASKTRYICCLDADDEIKPEFLSECTNILDIDPSIGLAYTKLEAVSQDGRISVSEWPEEYNYDGFLKRRNQVPTCCVFRRDIAVRLGGYRQRYAPTGAGSEDANLWLRFGSIGYAGKLATQQPLFRYHLGGAVGGNPNYKEVDWLAWNPETRDGKHPFASMASPSNNIFHEVPQYDAPLISVVIPVGPGHENHITNAIDSLEAQTFRKWEAIVVLDNNPNKDMKYFEDAYPYIRWFRTPKEGSGPGVARNIGAKEAKGKYLLFLDCDDSLLFDALYEMYLQAIENEGQAIYSDYMAISHTSKEELDRLQFQGRLIEHDENLATVIYNTPDYDCDLAQAQPSILNNGQFYIWNLISTLHPTSWWGEIGGFDEDMQSWEDWDYWLRLSRRGKCFIRITRPLIVYRFHTGMRRILANPEESGEEGRQLSSKLLQYLTDKREADEIMACSGCGSRRRVVPQPTPAYVPQSTPGNIESMSAGEQVLVELQDGNIGNHPISMEGTFYGYRSHGERFWMSRGHAMKYGNRVRIIEQEPAREPNTPTQSKEVQQLPPEPRQIENAVSLVEEAEEPEPPVSLVEREDLTKIWGINAERAKILEDAGVRTKSGLLSIDAKRLADMLKCSVSIANRILTRAE